MEEAAECGDALAAAFEGERTAGPGAHAERETRAAAITRDRWGESALAIGSIDPQPTVNGDQNPCDSGGGRASGVQSTEPPPEALFARRSAA